MPGQPGGPDELWVDEMAGPVLRPFAVAGGRTRQAYSDLDLIAIVLTAEVPMPAPGSLGTEDELILELCVRPRSVADLAADLALPVGVMRVLVGDLLRRGLVTVRRPATSRSGRPDPRLLKEVIDGLRAL
ncbi:DUF742 domain-containing protein [Actinomadura graeca]|uniref:DUF742 domain-containing protein n=1 Tax=Actinomadura graeca TaxID=2750812 RepID=A0ABX8QTW2_9ACTN|nr:DUF742 domain-containing protein [Actinomadura graeca]QXJ20877.1 DUF742 domain-containing protein [Actinomadura graeca]